MPKNAYIKKSQVNATAKAVPGPLPKGMAAKIITTPPRGELRQRFINYLTLKQLARRTVESYTGWIYQLAKFHRRSPDVLGNEEIQAWLLHLIHKRYSASSLNLAINAIRAFHGGMLGLDVEPLLKGIKRPKRRVQPPEVFSPEEIERLVTQGTEGDPLGRAFLMTVYGCGLRLSEAIHVQVSDIDSARHQLRVSAPKGGRQRLVPLSDNLLEELRTWYKVHRPRKWLFSQGPDEQPINRGTGQNLYYRARRRAGLQNPKWVFTLPAVLRPLALQNPKAIYTLLFEAASATLLQFGEERFGARLGITALLHTWGQNLMEHPHLHCLVTGGGLSAGATPVWVGPRQARYLFPVRAVARMFQGKFLAGLRQLRMDGKLEFHGRLKSWEDAGVWERTLGALGGAKWVVYGKGSVAGPEAVLEYLGRYTHRVAISNGRLVRMDARTVTFRYKDYSHKGTAREMTLDGTEFVRRLSLHILPPGFTKIRHYGILGNNQRAKLVPVARKALEGSRWHRVLAPVKAMPKPKREAAGCPRCGGDDLVCVGRLDASGDYIAMGRGSLKRYLKAGRPPKLCDSS